MPRSLSFFRNRRGNDGFGENDGYGENNGYYDDDEDDRKLRSYPNARNPVNMRVTCPRVLLVDEDGNQLETVSLGKALAQAHSKREDLVQLGLNRKTGEGRCIIISYNKFLHKQKKRQKQNAKPKPAKIKTARFREDIKSNDIRTKTNQSKKWLAKGLQVELVVSASRKMEQRVFNKPIIVRKPPRQKKAAGDDDDDKIMTTTQEPQRRRRKKRKVQRDFFGVNTQQALGLNLQDLKDSQVSGVYHVFQEILAELDGKAEIGGVKTNGMLFTMRIKPLKIKPTE